MLTIKLVKRKCEWKTQQQENKHVNLRRAKFMSQIIIYMCNQFNLISFDTIEKLIEYKKKAAQLPRWKTIKNKSAAATTTTTTICNINYLSCGAIKIYNKS